MVLIHEFNIYICFEIYGILFYEGNQEINYQVVLMVLNLVQSYQDNKHNSSKYSPILEFLVLQFERDNDMVTQHHIILDVCVNFLEIFYSSIKCNIS